MISKNKIQLMVPHASIKEFPLSKDISEERAMWVTRVMEYDVDIKITKIMRGKGFCEHIVSTFKNPNKDSLVLQEDQMTNIDT